jgi:hypothetical protein
MKVGDNLMIWDGKEHIPTNYEMYKHLCFLAGVEPKTELYDPYHRSREIIEIFGGKA